MTKVDERTWDYTVLDSYLNDGFLFSGKFKDLNNKVSLIAVGDISGITNMEYMFYECSSLTSVPLFDTSNVTNMGSMFQTCTSLTTVPLFDTSNVTNMNSMFYKCSSLTTVPLFDTSNVTDMYAMFYDCSKVESGALALYQQANATGKVTSHDDTFTNCGKDTSTGLAELQQIPQSWGGLAAG